MLTNTKHQVARWKWETTFDDQNSAYALQNLLSDWSDSYLKNELNRGLDGFCPADHIWRINRLELDLGELEYEDLHRELPRRFRHSLEESLAKLLLHQESLVLKDTELVTTRQSHMEALHHFLLHGTMPWGFPENEISLKRLVETLLKEQPKELAAMLRKTGQSDKVRKRLVWQCGEALVRKIIKILEPYHGETVIAFANHLVEVRQKERLEGKQLQQHRWLWILKHLFVERGTLFNTVMFVKQTIRQMAHYYQMDYRFLLSAIIGAARKTNRGNQPAPVFLRALLEIGAEQKKEDPPGQKLLRNIEHRTANIEEEIILKFKSEIRNPNSEFPKGSSSSSENLWRILERLLRKGQPHEAISGQLVETGELFAEMARQFPRRMAGFLPVVGRETRALRHMIAQFSVAELECVVRLVASENHPWILPHIHQTMEGLARYEKGSPQKKQQGLVWEVVLAYLFRNCGSYFNRKEFVKSTLLRICREEGILYPAFLSILSCADYPAPGILRCQAELLSIFQDLFREEEKRSPLRAADDVRWRALGMLLMHGKEYAQREGIFLSTAELFSLLLRQSPARIKKLLHRANAQDPHRFYIRLLKIVHYRDLFRLIRCLSPGLADLAISFPALFRSWNASRPLESLRGVDLFAALHEAVLYTLLDAGRKEPSAEAFVEALMKRLVKTHPIQPGQWNVELSARLREPENSSQLEKLMALVLEKESGKKLEPAPRHLSKEGGEKGALPRQSEQLLALCLHWLRHGGPPPSFAGSEKISLEMVMREILTKQVQLFPSLLQTIQKDMAAMGRLFSAVEFETFISALCSSHPELEASCSVLKGLNRIAHRLGIRGAHSSEFRQTLLELLLESWRNLSWKQLAPETILQELSWRMVRHHHVSAKAMEHSFQEWKHLLPPGVQLVKKLRLRKTEEIIPEAPKPQERDPLEPMADLALPVSNAGLVLLQGYFSVYLERLKLLKNKKFVSAEAQRKAVHYLQFLATGQKETEEHHLSLNKVLCGLSLSEPLEAGIDPALWEVELAEGLILAMLDHWPAIGSTSLNGFRGNWLVRQGAFTEKENQWELTVEKKPYDLLLNKAPFTFSIIKFKWMEKPIHVSWPY